ncbi:MAG: MlaD family protein [Saprospiraceae bacterium]
MSNEVKIGILAIVAISLSIFGYKFLKGQNILTSSNIIEVEYNKIDQLAISAPVLINGFQVGVISNIYLKPTDVEKIIVVLNIRKDVKIHKDAIAEIYSPSVMGGKAIQIVNNDLCSGADCAQGTIQGVTKGLMASMIGDENMDRYIGSLSTEFGEIMDTLNNKLSDPNGKGLARSFRNLDASLANLRSTTENIDRLVGRSTGKVGNILGNLESMTQSLTASNEDIRNLIKNASQFSAQLNDVDLGKTMTKANGTIDNADVAIQKLQQTLEKSNEAMAEINALVKKVNNGEGTLGLLVNDQELYNSLTKTSNQLDAFLKDFKDRPYRYVPFKGRKRVNRYDRKDAKEAAEQ